MAAAGAVTKTAATTYLPRTRDLFLNLLSRAATLSHLTQIHAQLLHHGYQNDIASATKLTQRLFDFNAVHHARSLFFTVSEPDRFLYNVLVKGLASKDSPRSAISVFNRLRESCNLGPDNFTYAFVIPAAASLGDVKVGDSLHGQAIVAGFGCDLFIGSALVDFYFKLGRDDCARKVFDGLPRRDTVLFTGLISLYTKCGDVETGKVLFGQIGRKDLISCNAMIAGFTCNGETNSAVRLFRELLEMQMSHISPNPVTVTSILSACAQLGALSLGQWVHGLIRNNNFESNIYVSTALIDMYAKCGSIVEARLLFDSIPNKNEVTWNAMISGYGLHGHGQEALKLFYEMLNSGISLSRITFLSILYACSHSGLVKEGDEIFKSMIRDHGFQPITEHYACMVDILGRAGKLEEALEFIKGIPENPSPPIWSTLLGACMIHKDMNMARLASEKLFELDPENMGYYVLMSNIYSSERNFPGAAFVRQVAKKRKLVKTPGCTLVEIHQKPHVFKAGDWSHPQSTAIHAELEKLNTKMKEAGYQADTITALHDVEEEEKELMVKVHSEKLAIAFGLISTEPGTEIRIFKNLRICQDCHTASKYISKITHRVIVARDANRFHHFKDGSCSCGDYW
ncbi:Pentatricopeptide repeat-containing protein At4g30700 [Linum grandiflorum]